MKNWPPENIRKIAQEFLLLVHKFALVGSLLFSVFIGALPVAMLCDSGDYLACIKMGLLIMVMVAGASLATIGLALVALRNQSRRSQIFLLVYSTLLVTFSYLSLQSASNFSSLFIAIDILGTATAVGVMVFGVCRPPSSSE